MQPDEMEFWLNNDDSAAEKAESPTAAATPPAPPTPDKHVTIDSDDDYSKVDDVSVILS